MQPQLQNGPFNFQDFGPQMAGGLPPHLTGAHVQQIPRSMPPPPTGMKPPYYVQNVARGPPFQPELERQRQLLQHAQVQQQQQQAMIQQQQQMAQKELATRTARVLPASQKPPPELARPPQAIPVPPVASTSKPIPTTNLKASVPGGLKPVYRPSPGCLAIMRLIEFFDHLPLIHQSERKLLDAWVEDYFLESGTVKLILAHFDDPALAKEFVFPAVALPIVFARWMAFNMTDCAFSLHGLSEHLITQPTNPTTASVVGYLVEASLIHMHTAYSNGTQVTLKGTMDCRFVRIPTYAPDGQLLSASLKIDKILLSCTSHSHAVLRDKLQPISKPLSSSGDGKKDKLNAVSLPELKTGAYGLPDDVMVILSLVESVGALTDLMTLTDYNEEPTAVLDSFLDITKGRINSLTVNQPLPPQPTFARPHPKAPSLDLSRVTMIGNGGPSSAPPLQTNDFHNLPPVARHNASAPTSPEQTQELPTGNKKRKEPPEESSSPRKSNPSPKVSPRQQRPKRGKSGTT